MPATIIHQEAIANTHPFQLDEKVLKSERSKSEERRKKIPIIENH
jgi:hypothetical protein